MKYKLLALDIDGTTLNRKGELTATTKQWIEKAVAAGITVIFATGRGARTANKIRAAVGLDDAPMVFLNGAQVWANQTRLLAQHFMDQSVNSKLYELAKAHKSWFWLYTEEGMVTREDFRQEIIDQPWVKFGLHHQDPNKITEFFNTIVSWGNLEVTQSAPENVEVGALGVTKASGVQLICDYLGITMAEVVAIGDSLNDYALITEAGLGIAMNNGDPRVKAVADEITETNDNHGVAKAIQRILG